MAVGRRAVFLDKDGTLVENVPYNVDPAQIRLTTGATEALLALRAGGFRLFVVSNQSGVARGIFPEGRMRGVEMRLRRMLPPEAGIDGFYYCPHHPGGIVAGYAAACLCRKPAPGMLLDAAADHDVDLAASWIIGDILDDVEAGRRAGCRAVLVDNGGETEWRTGVYRQADYVARDLPDAASYIISRRER